MVKIAHAPAAGDGLIKHRSSGHLFNILGGNKPIVSRLERKPRLHPELPLHNMRNKVVLPCPIRPHQADLFSRIELE